MDLFGSGLVTGLTGRVRGYADRTAAYRPDFGYMPFSASASYEFQPAAVSATPEPASMLLLGTGLAGLLIRRRKRT